MIVITGNKQKEGEHTMKYLTQGSYTAEACAAMIKNPQNRGEIVRKAIEKIGGRLEGFWFAFGDYDFALISESPDNVTTAALLLAVSASGNFKALKTTPLITTEEALEAMKKAAGTAYRPPTR